MGSVGLQIAAILLAAYLIKHLLMLILKKLLKSGLKKVEGESKRDSEMRLKTVLSILNSVIGVTVWVIAGIAALGAAGVNTAPLVAGAGVLGVALGFGAQSLIEDFISGLFIVSENQYRVGDVVKLGDIGGKVERISMRSTTLRDLDGNLHHIPNGHIKVVTNKTMDFARVNMVVSVSYDSDIDKVEKVINEIGQAMAKDPAWSGDILQAPHFTRISKFADSGVEVKILGKVKPTRRWAVAGELRRRIKKRFAKEGIEIPYPQIVVHRKAGK